VARAVYTAGLKQCPKNVALWILASRLEELDGKSIKARALLERARMANPASEQLWAEAVGVEERSGGATHAKACLPEVRTTTTAFHESYLTRHSLNRFTRVPRVRSLMDAVGLVRTSTYQEDAFGRRSPKNKR